MRAWSIVVCAVFALSGCEVEFRLDRDRDDDGILNIDDYCPDEFGPASNGGCPTNDRDSDGVVNTSDACPDVAGPASNNGCPVPSSNVYGVKPGAGLSFEGLEWGFGVTADGSGNWTVSLVGNPDLNEDRFSGSAYVTTGSLGSISACQTCQASGIVSSTSTQIDFDAIISNAGLAGFTFTHSSPSSPVYLDAYVNNGKVGTWRIYFVSTDTNQVATAPENPVALVSP